MLAMVANDNAGCQVSRGVCASIASMLAPTGFMSWRRARVERRSCARASRSRSRPPRTAR
ncbi:hypothetical protein DKY63_26350 [Pseudomonas putida]|uniref:Uncharacterized protein n=1 Tax=Pseudomonas putida TaxID=303 RepID=A0A2Z4RQK1_PSEPU|nr:hypothetical protein DKY63_26350 [Pseudomonas putida]